MENLITDTVRKSLAELELDYCEEDGVFDFSIKEEHTNVDLRVFCIEEQEILIAVATSRVFVPNDKIEEVCRWICDKNYKGNIGYYTIDTKDGEVSFRVSCPLDGGAINAEIAKVAIINALKRIDDDYVELLKLVYFDESQNDSADGKLRRIAESLSDDQKKHFS